MMQIELLEEQRLLRESLERYMANGYSFAQRAKNISSGPSSRREHWRSLAQMGLMALPFSEEDGGMGCGGAEIAVVQEQFGRALVVEPYLPSVVLCGSLLKSSGNQRSAELIAELIEGGVILAFAHHEAETRYDPTAILTTAVSSDAGYVIDGSKTAVVAGEEADFLLVSARMDKGIGIFVVSPRLPGVDINGYQTNDQRRAAEIVLSGVEVKESDLLIKPGDGVDAILLALDQAAIALCAEAIGVMQSTWEQTVEYLSVRKQFNKALKEFQVLQHRIVDMRIEIEQARSMSVLASLAWDMEPPVRTRFVSAAKARIGKAGRFVGQHAIQLHGGIGMAAETPVSHYFKRLTMMEYEFGNTTSHLRRFLKS